MTVHRPKFDEFRLKFRPNSTTHFFFNSTGSWVVFHNGLVVLWYVNWLDDEVEVEDVTGQNLTNFV